MRGSTASLRSTGTPQAHTVGPSQPPLVLHVVNQLLIGGLENGLVNLINRIPAERYRHAVVCLTSYSDFQDRIHQQGVPVIALNKRNRFDTDVYTRFWNVIQHLKPAIVHTRNLPSLEFQVPA